MRPQHVRHAGRHEVLLGRTLAVCVHPVAAWRSSAPRARTLVVAGYFIAGYAGTLVAIATLR